MAESAGPGIQFQPMRHRGAPSRNDVFLVSRRDAWHSSPALQTLDAQGRVCYLKLRQPSCNHEGTSRKMKATCWGGRNRKIEKSGCLVMLLRYRVDQPQHCLPPAFSLSKYGRPLNNAGLNNVSPIMHGFFYEYKTYYKRIFFLRWFVCLSKLCA